MAINVGTAIAFLELDMSGFKNSLSAAGADLKNFASSGDIQNISNAMSGVGSELTKKVTLPIAGIGAAAVNASADFEAQMSKVKAISGAVGEEFDGLRNQAIQLGADTNFSASEAANGMEDLASAGFKTNEIMAAMPGVLDLAAAGAVSISDAASIAGSTLRGFGLEAEQVGHVGDVLAKLAGDTNAGIMDTGEAMKYIAPVSKALGISLEDTSAAIGMLSDAGIQGGQAGTVLRGALINLAKPTDASAALMKELGINAFDANGKMKPLNEVVANLKDSTANLTSEQKASAFATIFGKEAMSGMLTLVDQGPEKLSKLSETLKNCDGASKEMAGTMQDNLKGSIEAMKGSIETAAIKIGDVLSPMIKDCANWIADLVNKFSALPKETQEFIVKIALVAAAVGPVLIVLAKLIESVRTVISVFTGISKIASIVSALPALMNPPVLAIIAIVAAIGFIVYEVIKHWDDLKEYFGGFWDWLKKIFSQFWEWLKSFFTQWGPIILAIIAPFLGIPLIIWQHWDKVKEWLQPIFDWMCNAFDKVVSFFSNGLAGLKEAFDDFTSWASGIGKNICEGLINGLEAGWDWVFDKVGSMAQKIKDIFTSLLDIHSPSRVFRSYGSYIGEGLVEGINSSTDSVENATRNTANKVTEGFKNAINSDKASELVSSYGSDAMGAIAGVMSNNFPAIASSISGMSSYINGLLENLPVPVATILNNELGAVGSKLKEMAIDWASSKIEMSASSGVISSVTEKLKLHTSAVNISSLATNAATIATTALSSATSIFSTVMSLLTGPIGLVVLAITGLIAVGYLLWNNWDYIGAKLKSVWEGIRDFATNIFSGLGAVFEGFGTNIMDGLLNGIMGGIEGIKNCFKSISDTIKNTFKTLLGINSPSKVFDEYGNFIGEGLINGLDRQDSNITSKFEGLGNKIKSLGNVKPDFNFSNAAGAYSGSSSSILNNAPKHYTFSPEIKMQISIADAGAKGTAQLTSELKSMAQTAVKNSMVDEFMADALRL